MIVRNGQKLGSVLVDSGEAESKPKQQATKKAPAKKKAAVKTATSQPTFGLTESKSEEAGHDDDSASA